MGGGIRIILVFFFSFFIFIFCFQTKYFFSFFFIFILQIIYPKFFQDFDYSEFELYRSGVKDIFRFCAQFCTLDLFFSTLHSFLSSSSSSSPDWRKLESVIFASNAIIKTILSRSLSPSSHSFSFSSASSLGGGTPSASPLPLPRQFISILSLSLSSPLFPLLTATVLQFVGEFGALFSGQFDIEQEIALNCVKVLFDGMQVPALISRFFFFFFFFSFFSSFFSFPFNFYFLTWRIEHVVLLRN